MAELGEPVAVGIISEDKWECPFEHDKPRDELENALDGDSSKLTSRMEGGKSTCLWKEGADKKISKATNPAKARPKDELAQPPVNVKIEVEAPNPNYQPANALPAGDGKIVRYSIGSTPSLSDGQYQYQGEAHHIIPTNVMSKSKLKEYLESGSTIDNNVGYDINGCENGIWLPGSKPPSSPLPGISMSLTLAIYYRSVMDQTNRQMHGKNLKDYDDFFKEKLEAIRQSFIAAPDVGQCQKCKDIRKNNGKFPPPHGIVFRLNSLSDRIEKKLCGGSMNWMPPVIISKSAKTYYMMSRAAVFGGSF